MRLKAIKDKAYITSAGEKAVHTGLMYHDGDHILDMGDQGDHFKDDGSHWSGSRSDIIDEWPETADAPEGHVNTAEIVYPGKSLAELKLSVGDKFGWDIGSIEWEATELRIEKNFPGLRRDERRWHIASRASKPVTHDGWGDWIGWNGGECPVDDGKEVSVVLYGEDVERFRTAGQFRWAKNAVGPIIKYRTRKAPVMTTVTLFARCDQNRWRISDGPLPMEGDTHMFTFVKTDGSLESIANVEAIK